MTNIETNKIFAGENRSDAETIYNLLFILDLMQTKESNYMKSLIEQMNSMEEQIVKLNIQLEETRTQLLNQPKLKDKIKEMPDKVHEKVLDVKQSISELKAYIADKGRELFENIKQKGELKLYTFLDKTKIMNMLDTIRQKLTNCIKSLENGIKRIDSIENELKQSGQHIKNAVRLATGKDAQEKEPAEANNPFSNVLRSALRTCQGMLDNVNRSILAYDRLENSVISKNPSVLKKIGAYKENENTKNKGKVNVEKRQEAER